MSPPQSKKTTPSILGVLVVYKKDINNISIFRSLCDAATGPGESRNTLTNILIYDNSPERSEIPGLNQLTIFYTHDPSNGGTASAYNAALQIAIDKGFDWLLFLDQDTLILPSFFNLIDHHLSEWALLSNVAAIVPRVYHDTTPISPAIITAFGGIAPISLNSNIEPSKISRPITAIASGTLLNVSVISNFFPIPHPLWLDYVDHWIFYQIHKKRKNVLFINYTIQHDLSIMNPDWVAPARLFSILDGEFFFYSSMGNTYKALFLLRLFYRFLKGTINRNPTAGYIISWCKTTAAKKIKSWISR